MTVVYIKELKHSFKTWCVWTGAMIFMLLVCILIFPEMKNQMENVTDIFSDMGDFTAAFGMDKLNFGEIMGYYGTECGNVLGIGGSFFAALTAAAVLSAEEKNRTAEFLFTHPVSRSNVLIQKLLAVYTRIIAMNIVIVLISILGFAAIGEKIEVMELLLLHLAYTILQLEIGSVCFGVSAFIRRGSIGIGIGIAFALYFFNIVSNISEQAEALKYITPFAYADAGNIISNSEIDIGLILLGCLYSAAGVAAGFVKYTKKDLAA